MKILIDARMYGPKHTGNGIYTQNLVENLAGIDQKNTYFLLLRREMMGEVKLPGNWEKIEADFRHYSIAEQLMLPSIIKKYKPDIVHFPHFNVPVFYFGKYIVTIHDLIMHKFKGREATTKPLIFYPFIRLGYFISFAKAVFGSTKIIVPSHSVKSDLLKNYKVPSEKVEVIYE